MFENYPDQGGTFVYVWRYILQACLLELRHFRAEGAMRIKLTQKATMYYISLALLTKKMPLSTASRILLFTVGLTRSPNFYRAWNGHQFLDFHRGKKVQQ